MKLFLPPVKRYDELLIEGLGIEVSGPRWDAISVTGTKCWLMCRHCSAILLEYMRSVTSISQLRKWIASEGLPRCVLVSGGCNSLGYVPLDSASNILRVLRELGVSLYVHTGIVSPSIARLARALGFRALMFDVFSSRCGSFVRNLRFYSEAAMLRALELCERQNLPCVPHIVVGELCGEASDEMDLIDLLASYRVPQVNIVVFTPLPGSFFEWCSPPSHSYVSRVLKIARDRLSSTRLVLGCMKPQWGRYRGLELEAADLGFDAIAAPSLETIEVLARRGEARVFRGCCSSLVGEAYA
ncbi:MAG: hypothetical protein GXO32_07185 [Crenarchaeota archaeon]|nr:hypothetical protein [Thermoproteota archaeon]